jgi:Transglutaminase-like superfamily
VKAMIRSWQTFCSLERDEREVARAAAIGLTATWLGLRLLGFRRWRGVIARRAERGAQVGERARGISAKRIVQLETAAARNLFFETNCLEQSLVLWPLLRRRGFPAELKIGARKDEGRFEAHAWVELDGKALNDENRGFVPFERAVAATESSAE